MKINEHLPVLSPYKTLAPSNVKFIFYLNFPIHLFINLKYPVASYSSKDSHFKNLDFLLYYESI